jgi:hypothetical protein
MLSCKIEPYRLSMIPVAYGASATRLNCSPGPEDHAEKAHSIRSGIVTNVDLAMLESSTKAMTWTTIPLMSDFGIPTRSVMNPPNLDPIKVAIPKAKRAMLTCRSLMDVTFSRNGAIYA